jgi:hypothetical protein
MASRYWVGGTAAWDGTAGTKWALTSGGAGGQAVPTSADDVFFTNLSTGTCTISTGNTGAKSITCTGHTGTIAGTAAISVAGSVTLVAGQTVTYSGTLTLTATGTLTTAGKTLGAVTVAATGGTVTLGSALTSSNVVTLTDGTLTTSASNYAITATQFVASGAGTKTLTLNGSTVTLSATVSTAFDYSGSNLTLNAGTSTINLSGSGADFAGGGLTFNNVAFTATTGGGGVSSVTGANTFAQLTFTALSSGLVQFDFGANQTITTFVCAGASAVRRIMVSSNTPGTARTLTVGTYTTKTDVDFRDITAAGASAPWSGTRLGNCKGCTSITFDAAKTVYWNLAGTQNWSATGWATTSGGSPAVNNFPLAQDTATFNNAGSAGTVTIESNWNIGTMTAASRTTAMTLQAATSFRVYGDWTSSSAVTNSSAGSIYFEGRTTQTIISAGGTFSFIATESASTISLGDALTTTTAGVGITVIGGGTFNANTYSYAGSNVAIISSSINLGTASFTLSGTGVVWGVTVSTVSGSGEIILSNTSTTARTFNGGSQTYGKLTIGGTTGTSTLTITGANTFTEIASTKTVAHTIVFPNSTTTTGAFTVQGSSGNVVTLSRTGASGTFTLSKSGGGIVSSNYLSISNSTASPSNTWYAGANSTDGGGNTGWIFTNASSGSNFLMFF